MLTRWMVLSIIFMPYAWSANKPVPPKSKVYKFEKKIATVGSVKVLAEIANTEELRERGLMDRTKLADSEGMLFVFDRAQVVNFWMKNTLIPLSIGYFDEKGVLLQITEMVPASPMEIRPKTYPSKRPTKYALEEPAGWYTRHKIKPGALLRVLGMGPSGRP